MFYLRAIAVMIALSASAAAQDKPAELPIDITGPDQRVPRALGAASLFPVKNLPEGAEAVLFMVPDGVGEFFDLANRRDGNPVGIFTCDTPGTYTCVVVAIIGGKLARDTHTITVGGPTPIPPGPIPPGPVPPGPVPPEPEPIPDGKLGFTRMAFTEASKVAAASRVKSKALADNFESTASAIAAGAVRTVDEANALMVQKNRAALTDGERPHWLPFFTAWSQKADAALKDGSLKATIADYQAVYEATAQGLRRVK